MLSSHATISIAAGARVEGLYGMLLNTITGADVSVGGAISSPSTPAILFGGGDNALTVLPSYSIDGLVLGGPDTDTLILGGASGDGSFDLDLIDNQFISFEAFRKTGGSTWSLSGATFGGTLSADAGTLKVNGDIPGLDLMLTGTGRVGGTGNFNSLVSSAIVAPGNSIGTLNVAGDVTFAAGATYEAEIDAASASDLLAAGGTATISSAAGIVVLPTAGTYAASTSYTILTATDGVTGSFGTVSVASPFLAATAASLANSVVLTVTRNSTTVANAGQTPNQSAAGASLDALGLNAPYLGEILVLPAAAVPGALDALSGDGHASLRTALLDDSGFIRDAVLQRQLTTRAALPTLAIGAYAAGAQPAEAEKHLGVWGHAHGGQGSIEGDGNAPGVTATSGGLIAGIDGDAGSGRAGALLGYGMTGFSLPSRSMSGTSSGYSIGAYGGIEGDGTYLSLGGSYTRHQVATRRAAAFPGVGDTFSASYAGNMVQAFSETGHKFDFGAAAATPFAGLAYATTATDAFSESGGAGALSVAAAQANEVLATLGLRVEQQFVLGNGVLVSASASAAWRHAFAAAPTGSNAFAGGGPFAVSGVAPAAETALLSAGLDAQLSSQTSLDLAYRGEFAPGAQSQSVTGTLSGGF